MITTTLDLIKRAQLAADMHDGPFTPDQWMYWATPENIALSSFLARSGWTQNIKTQTIEVLSTDGADEVPGTYAQVDLALGAWWHVTPMAGDLPGLPIVRTTTIGTAGNGTTVALMSVSLDSEWFALHPTVPQTPGVYQVDGSATQLVIVVPINFSYEDVDALVAASSLLQIVTSRVSSYPGITQSLDFANGAGLPIGGPVVMSGGTDGITYNPRNAYTLGSNPLAIAAIHQIGSDGRVRRIHYNHSVDFLRQEVDSTAETGDPIEYRVLWDQDNDAYVVNFYPCPQTGARFLVSYIPHPLRLVVGTPGDGEANSVSYPLGFEEWIVLKLAIRAKKTEESDPSDLVAEFKELQGRIEENVSDFVWSGATVRNVDRDERGWTNRIVYPPADSWWFA